MGRKRSDLKSFGVSSDIFKYLNERDVILRRLAAENQAKENQTLQNKNSGSDGMKKQVNLTVGKALSECGAMSSAKSHVKKDKASTSSNQSNLAEEEMQLVSAEASRLLQKKDDGLNRQPVQREVPVILGMEHIADNPTQFYQAVSKQFPNAKLSLTLCATRQFLEKDQKSCGLVEIKQLWLFFAETFTFLNKKEVREILEEAELGDRKSLNFMELLLVMHMLHESQQSKCPFLTWNYE